ncbi:DUF317 domain-containing protein [Streptomyces neyagawaensis]|uniref:DUF317 domain-containing protein n=1 Tax=Streptomyces neyagawaensis TaxID=42238 RepID=UPI0006E36FBC|nr:DUF317 domain-containing protein [Streptomyces neyagawaensis]MCL6737724.1 DUF317 domain-containing protein [Streptomyces neyagawaensis]MDE1687714.1 DUF317 domain-containing protein [Streptomyces neyagawaensis]MDG5808473.1 DUF317 domain-containing protein [Streptomyces ossamyceticus]
MPVTARQLAAFRRDHESTIPRATSPRYLAGAGDARHVTHALLAAGWNITSDPASPETELTSPDLQTRLQAAPQFTPSGNWWRLTVEPPNSRTWYASFTRHVPTEILAGLTDSLLTPVPEDVADPWDLFRSAGWSVTQSENGTGLEARSPDQRAIVEYSRPQYDETRACSWRIRAKEYPLDAAESSFVGRSIWDGWLDGHTPGHTIAGFITALTSDEPLLRGWGHHGWHHAVQHEPTSRTGRDVADAHQQRLKHVQARVRAAHRQRLNAAPSPAVAAPAAASTARAR